MNLRAKIDAVGRHDEIFLPQDSFIKYINKSATVNVQMVEFAPSGQLAALALKSGHLLIMDYFTMGIVRIFVLSEDYGLAANEDIDQFYPFWKVINYFDEDFIFKQKPKESVKDCENFLQEKYASRKAKDPSVELPKRINLQEVKGGGTSNVQQQQHQTKISIANITWGQGKSNNLIGATFRQKQQLSQNTQVSQSDQQSIFVVWDVITCRRVCQIDFACLNISSVVLNPYNNLYSTIQAVVSGDQSLTLQLDFVNCQIDNCSSRADFTVVERKVLLNAQQTTQEQAQQTKRKGNITKQYNQIVMGITDDKYILISNSQKQMYLLQQVPQSIVKVKDVTNYINTNHFQILAIQKVELQFSSFASHATVNSDHTKLLLNSSDRILRLYKVDSKNNSFTHLNSFQDVISHQRWHQAHFINLPSITKIVSENSTQEKTFMTQQTTLNLANTQQFANLSQELFVASSGEQNADCLRFFNTCGNYREIKRIEFQQEGCSHMTVHSGISSLNTHEQNVSVHLSVMLASSNGSLMVWSARPAKFIQPLAPNFIEIDDNVMYVEREDEFESEQSDDGDLMDLDDELVSIDPLTSKQKKLSSLIELPDINQVQKDYLQVQVQSDDSFAVLARKHINQLKDKFNSLLPQPSAHYDGNQSTVYQEQKRC